VKETMEGSKLTKETIGESETIGGSQTMGGSKAQKNNG
jgi:hypothetical protein